MINRRDFIKTSAAIAAAAMLDWKSPYASSFEKEHETSPSKFSLLTDMTIDQLIDEYSPREDRKIWEVKETTNTLLTKYKTTIAARAAEYQAPANLLAAIIAMESDRGYEKPITDIVSRIFNSDHSAGIAQIMLGRATWILSGVVEKKGIGYVLGKLPDWSKSDQEKLRKHMQDYVPERMNGKDTGKSEAGKKLMEKLLNADELSLEMAACYTGYMWNKIQEAHTDFSVEHLRSNPFAVYMLMKSYREGENELNKPRSARSPKDLEPFILKSMAPLHSGSFINKLFPYDDMSIVPEKTLSTKMESDCKICRDDIYRPLMTSIGRAYDAHEGLIKEEGLDKNTPRGRRYFAASQMLQAASKKSREHAQSQKEIEKKRQYYAISIYCLDQAIVFADEIQHTSKWRLLPGYRKEYSSRWKEFKGLYMDGKVPNDVTVYIDSIPKSVKRIRPPNELP